MSSYKVVTTIARDIFRSYDIRGIVGENFLPNNVYTIGLAIGSEVQHRGKREIIIGRDGRLSGPELLRALEQGLLDSGCNVINIGEVTTPVLYFATHVLSSNSGVMLTGSHNPPNYNGIKVVIDGETLYEDAILQLYQRIVTQNLIYGNGKAEIYDNIIAEYIERVLSDVKLERKLKIVIDCGNGVGGKVAPELYRKIGCEVIELFCSVDGNFPNHHPDPSDPQNMQDLIAAVKSNKANVGLAFDGDADRIGVVTDKGDIILPDRILMFFVIDLLSRHNGATIPYDVKCTRHLAEQIIKHHGTPIMTRTGHSLVKAKMREVNALLAGEFSGHIFFKERWYGFDDGIYAGVRLLELLSQTRRKCSALFAALPDSFNTPELKVAISDNEKYAFIENLKMHAKFDGGKVTTIDGIRVDFNDGFGLIRASNTTPFLILRFEGDTKEAENRIKSIFKEQVLAFAPGIMLPF
jgi:phosphomannomutase / phosphoglucomutase